ncbi:MAG: hypothetical protein ACLRPT_02305 [Akkermansia muciniphila]
MTAVQIPSGDVLTLPEGERVYITQILGGSYTVATDHGLARISRRTRTPLALERKNPLRKRLRWMRTPHWKKGSGIR